LKGEAKPIRANRRASAAENLLLWLVQLQLAQAIGDLRSDLGDSHSLLHHQLTGERLAALGARALEGPRRVIDKREILEAASTFQLLPNVVEKDYVLGWLLGRHQRPSGDFRKLGFQRRHLPQEVLLRDLPVLGGPRFHAS